MSMKCRERWESLVDFAEGKPSHETAAHLATCRECAREVDRLRRVFAAAHVVTEAAPQSAIERAKQMMPIQRKRFKLVRSTLQFSGARAVGQAFQAVYEIAGTQIRVAYTQTESGWEAVSQLPEGASTVKWAGLELIPDEDGRFYFTVRDLAEAAFTLSGGNVVMEVPSPEEAASDLE